MTNSEMAAELLMCKGKMVELDVSRDGGDEVETLPGRVIDANDLGVIFKRRSQRGQDLFDLDQVRGVRETVTARLRMVSQKSLRPATVATVKRHLADYHGFPISTLNTMSEEEALRRHEEIDHEDLGHNHNGEAQKPKQAPRERESREDILARIASADEERKTA